MDIGIKTADNMKVSYHLKQGKSTPLIEIVNIDPSLLTETQCKTLMACPRCALGTIDLDGPIYTCDWLGGKIVGWRTNWAVPDLIDPLDQWASIIQLLDARAIAQTRRQDLDDAAIAKKIERQAAEQKNKNLDSAKIKMADLTNKLKRAETKVAKVAKELKIVEWLVSSGSDDQLALFLGGLLDSAEIKEIIRTQLLADLDGFPKFCGAMPGCDGCEMDHCVHEISEIFGPEFDILVAITAAAPVESTVRAYSHTYRCCCCNKSITRHSARVMIDSPFGQLMHEYAL